MIAYIKGELTEVKNKYLIIDHHGMGYEIAVPESVIEEVSGMIGDTIKIYTYLHVKEDGMSLYGFSSKDDLSVFKLLLTVNGIGPKGALGILSAISADNLRFAVLSDDVKAISKAPGIGAKTAGKLILELKDKFKLEDAFEAKFSHNETFQGTGSPATGIREEAAQALIALGYSQTEALAAVRKVELKENITVEDVLKQSLRQL